MYVAPHRYVSLFTPSLQWVPWPLLTEALRFPTFVGHADWRIMPNGLVFPEIHGELFVIGSA